MRSARLLLVAALAGLLPACLVAPRPPGAVPGSAYLLPFEDGTSHLLVQEGPGPFSHADDQRYAVDFEMPENTRVLAARAGVVVGVKEDSDVGGPSAKYANDGNFVVVQHADGTRARYLHLRQDGAHVVVGQRVRRGQVIGSSGSTGWSFFPHLHFQVDAWQQGRWSSIPVAFADVEQDGVPRLGRQYRSANPLDPDTPPELRPVPPGVSRGAFR
jgi:murein DD-endopeptidase MepM/ murein hydrolase activator NlpD